MLLRRRTGIVGRLIAGLRLETGLLAGGMLLLAGVASGVAVLVRCAQYDFGDLDASHVAITAVTLTTAGAQLALISGFAGSSTSGNVVAVPHERVVAPQHQPQAS